MKLLKTIKKLVQESELRYTEACDKGLDEKLIKKLERDYYDSLALMKKINKVENDNKKND
jgi:hypothetical protein